MQEIEPVERREAKRRVLIDDLILTCLISPMRMLNNLARLQQGTTVQHVRLSLSPPLKRELVSSVQCGQICEYVHGHPHYLFEQHDEKNSTERERERGE